MADNSAVRLELTWPGKDKFLLTPSGDEGKPVWVERDHPAATEVRLATVTGSHGDLDTSTGDAFGENLLFTGDSLDVLRILHDTAEYADRYRGKIRLAYFDPPFNTGNTFHQYDDWMEHSTWLSFMRERLLLTFDLLAEDGSIWLHLDDVEMHRMRSVLDEIFGANNFVATVVWQKADSTRNDARGLSTDHDSILIYRRTSEWTMNRLPRTAESDARFSSPDGDPEPWFDDNPTAPGAATHQGMVYAIQQPITGHLIYPARGRCWSFEQARMLEEMSKWAPYELRDIDDGDERARLCGVRADAIRGGVKAVMVKGDLADARRAARARYDAGNWPVLVLRSGGDGGLGRKSYVPTAGLVPGTWWDNGSVGHNRQSKAESKALFPGSTAFATPKPERLLERVIHIGSNPGDIVLDVFAGSGTTAAVAHKMGRRWVTAELNPATVRDFTRPRLAKVVDGDDPGGITEKVGWAGGGGFVDVTVGPSMYEVTPAGVLLAEWATNGQFARAVAAQLGFRFEADAAPLCGRRGRMRLAVFDGAVGAEEVREVVGALGDGERVTIVGKTVLPGAEEALVGLSRGSRVLKAPRDVLADNTPRKTPPAMGNSGDPEPAGSHRGGPA